MIRFALCAFLLQLGACGVTESHHVLTGSVGAPRTGDVQILMGDEAPPPGLTEVALLQTIGRGTDADLEHVIGGLKERARELGCVVVAKVKIEQGSSTASGTGVCLRN
jgi:hypothetical protein